MAGTVSVTVADRQPAAVDAEAAPTAEPPGSREDEFTALRIKDVVHETVDAISLILDVPAEHVHRFGYQAGQYLTVAVSIAGQEYRRCYSMSSSPVGSEDLRITVKRDPGGMVSNWLNDVAAPGAAIYAAPPVGRFVLGDAQRELVCFAGGSGITPVFSLIRSALLGTTRTARLFYANRSRGSVIFADALAAMAECHGDRFTVVHHVDEEHGMVQPDVIASFLVDAVDADYYVCGPGKFMDVVEAALLGGGVDADRLHLERFQSPAVAVSPADAETITEEVTFELNRQIIVAPYRAGTTLLHTARLAGLKAPSSCETGSCGTCIARVVDGSARMLNNDALDDDEIAEGWILTCQSLPTSRAVRVTYE
jgi:ferredoxin-NADP reductase